MITIHDLEQGTDEWLALRAGKVTASRFSDVLSSGVGRGRYMRELAAETLTGAPAASFSNDAMAWGVEHEPQARAMFELETGLKVVECGFVENSDYPGVGVSPDGLIGNKGLIEIKCPNTTTHLEWILAGHKVPAKHKAQTQGQLLICERDYMSFVSFDPRIDRCLHIVDVGRDANYIEKLADALRQFSDELNEMLEKLK